MFKVNNKNTRITSMMHFSSVSIVDFEQVNVSSDVSEKTDLLPNNFQISRSSYYFDIISQLWSFLARKSQDKKTFSTKDLPLIKKNQPLHTKKTIFLFKGFVRTPLPPLPPPSPHPLNNQNLLSMTKLFCRCPLNTSLILCRKSTLII